MGAEAKGQANGKLVVVWPPRQSSLRFAGSELLSPSSSSLPAFGSLRSASGVWTAWRPLPGGSGLPFTGAPSKSATLLVPLRAFCAQEPLFSSAWPLRPTGEGLVEVSAAWLPYLEGLGPGKAVKPRGVLQLTERYRDPKQDYFGPGSDKTASHLQERS